MEVVQLVEVTGQGHQVMENFEDLILTVVPEGQEAEALAAAGSSEGQRTIVVTEVRNNPQEEDDSKNKQIESLQGRVEQLEDQVHFLEDELRIMRRKIHASMPSNSYNTIRRTVLEVLSKQTLKVSLSDFEDEMESEEPVGRSHQNQGQKRRRYENGFSDEEEDDDFSDDEPIGREPRVRKRRRPGRPPKGSTRKPKTFRVELTPPPPKVSRPRGRPRRVAKQEEDLPNAETEENMDSHIEHTIEDDVEANTTAEVGAEDGEPSFIIEDNLEEDMQEIHAEAKTQQIEAEAEPVPVTATKTAAVAVAEVKAVTKPEPADDSKPASPAKRGRPPRATPQAQEQVEASTPTPAPVRVSTRARKISRKASD